jgi:hypothetical protein
LRGWRGAGHARRAPPTPPGNPFQRDVVPLTARNGRSARVNGPSTE